MARRILLVIALMALSASFARAQEKITRSTDSTLTQKWVSDFGYSFMLPPKAKFNPIGSNVNAPGRTQMANFLLSGGNGAIKIWNYHETQVVPSGYKLLDSLICHDVDSVGVNGKIRTRSYIMDSVVVRIEILLTPKGFPEYADKVNAIFDSFTPPPGITMQLSKWRFEYGIPHDGSDKFYWEKRGHP